MARLPLLQAAAYAARHSTIPMTPVELWQAILDQGLHGYVRCGAKNPVQSLSAKISLHLKEDTAPFFTQVSAYPPRFSLLRENLSLDDLAQEIERLTHLATHPTTPARGRRLPFKERETHPFLVHFAHHGLEGAYTKTIYHEVSRRGGYGQWIHPDIVGFRYPFTTGNTDLISVLGGPDQVLTLLSFELKRELSLGSLRESFFQAVSNSSWAHEAYLVASFIDQGEDFRAELRRLSTSFGIGVIELSVEDPSLSAIILPAKVRPAVDFEAANKLATENPDFASFLKNVRIDVTSGYPHPVPTPSTLRPPFVATGTSAVNDDAQVSGAEPPLSRQERQVRGDLIIEPLVMRLLVFPT